MENKQGEERKTQATPAPERDENDNGRSTKEENNHSGKTSPSNGSDGQNLPDNKVNEKQNVEEKTESIMTDNTIRHTPSRRPFNHRQTATSTADEAAWDPRDVNPNQTWIHGFPDLPTGANVIDGAAQQEWSENGNNESNPEITNRFPGYTGRPHATSTGIRMAAHTGQAFRTYRDPKPAVPSETSSGAPPIRTEPQEGHVQYVRQRFQQTQQREGLENRFSQHTVGTPYDNGFSTGARPKTRIFQAEPQEDETTPTTAPTTKGKRMDDIKADIDRLEAQLQQMRIIHDIPAVRQKQQQDPSYMDQANRAHQKVVRQRDELMARLKDMTELASRRQDVFMQLPQYPRQHQNVEKIAKMINSSSTDNETVLCKIEDRIRMQKLSHEEIHDLLSTCLKGEAYRTYRQIHHLPVDRIITQLKRLHGKIENIIDLENEIIHFKREPGESLQKCMSRLETKIENTSYLHESSRREGRRVQLLTDFLFKSVSPETRKHLDYRRRRNARNNYIMPFEELLDEAMDYEEGNIPNTYHHTVVNAEIANTESNGVEVNETSILKPPKVQFPAEKKDASESRPYRPSHRDRTPTRSRSASPGYTPDSGNRRSRRTDRYGRRERSFEDRRRQEATSRQRERSRERFNSQERRRRERSPSAEGAYYARSASADSFARNNSRDRRRSQDRGRRDRSYSSDRYRGRANSPYPRQYDSYGRPNDDDKEAVYVSRGLMKQIIASNNQGQLQITQSPINQGKRRNYRRQYYQPYQQYYPYLPQPYYPPQQFQQTQQPQQQQQQQVMPSN